MKTFAYNIIFLVFLVVVLELIFGNWLQTDRLNRLNLVKDTQIVYQLNDLYEAEYDSVVYTRDEYGFRGDYPDVSSIDILTIGGSTTDQRYITDNQTWQHVLQKEFRDNGYDISVVNAGVDGQTTIGHTKNFEWWFPLIPELKVRYYLFFIGINDFYVNENSSYDELLKSDEEGFATRVKILLSSKSAIYNLMRTVKNISKARKLNVGHNHVLEFKYTDQPLLENHDAIMKNRLEAYGKRLSYLLEKVNLSGSRSIVVTQSMRRAYNTTSSNTVIGIDDTLGVMDSISFNGVDYYYMAKLMNEKTMEVCSQYNGICIDMDSELDFDIEADFYDRMHNTPAGADKIGKYLYNNLKDILFRER
jgi:hypothetical protein